MTTVSANPGYVLAQLEKALVTAAGHEDAAARERAAKKAQRFRQVMAGMLDGSIAVGSRTPVAGAPAWATLEVAHGGFATGGLLAGGALQPHEIELLREAPAPAGKERATLNLHFLGDEGRARLLDMLASGRYRVNVPEEGALLVVAWLLANGQGERAQAVLDEILPLADRLRFYPVPEFAALCTARGSAGVSEGGSWVARNGTILEQEQILTTHNLAAAFEVLGLTEPLRGRLPALAQACFRFICKREQIRTEKWHARLVRVKNSAYAWRQMVFFLSFLSPSEIEAFLAWAGEHLWAQGADFQKRFDPALRGLTIAAVGGDLDQAERTGAARRFLGWSTTRHWLLEGA